MSQTNYLQIVIFSLQRTAGPYRCAIRDQEYWNMVGVIRKTASAAARQKPIDYFDNAASRHVFLH